MGKQICQNNSPIGLTACEQLIRIALHIPYLKDEKPIGIMLIAQPGMGKSMLLTRFKSDNIVTANDLTGYGLEKTILECKKISKGYIVIPDLLRLQSRKAGWQAFLTLTNVILEEGLVGIARGDLNVRFKKPINFGILTAITADCFKTSLGYWQKVGFASRFALFSYSYEDSDFKRIEELVSNKANGHYGRIAIKPPARLRGDKRIDVSPKMADHIRCVGKIMANGKPSNFRSISFIRRLVKAHALMNNRGKATMEDIRNVFALVPFFVPPYPTSTDLEYFLLKGTPMKILERNYRDREIYEAERRLVNKQVYWARIVKPKMQ